MDDSFVRVVICIDKIGFPTIRQSRDIDGESVILRGDVTAASLQVCAGNIVASVAVQEFFGFGARSQGQDLVA